MGIRRKVQRRAARAARAKAPRRDRFLTTVGMTGGDCECPICDYLESIGAESEVIGGATVHRLSDEEMLVVDSLMRGGPFN